MNHKEARRKAMMFWGPLALAVRASDTDRNTRFRLGYMVEGEVGRMGVQMAGIGDSWESAFASAAKNEVAEKWRHELRERLKFKMQSNMRSVREAVEHAESNQLAESEVTGSEVAGPLGTGLPVLPGIDSGTNHR